MDMAFLGNIPTSSGLSSSSAMVVLSSLAAIEINGLEVGRKELVNLCGEGEWYVGTRGGAGDHAAMLFCRRDSICHLRFFPFEVTEYLPMPSGYDIVIANSMKSAHKAGEVLDAYNQTIAAYNMVLMMIKGAMADLEFSDELVEETLHLRDVNPDRIPLPDIYRIIRTLPTRASRAYVLEKFPEKSEEIGHIFRTHREPEEGYRTRAVALFGISECERGKMFAEILRAGKVEELGHLMFVEHNGDRVITHEGSKRIPWGNEVTDEMVDRLMEEASSSQEDIRSRSSLHFQSGGYGCSSPELDEMVDIARSVPGVLGAGLTGAGFGGCIRILVGSDSVPALLDALKTRYYDPRKLPLVAEVVQSVARAGVLGGE
jgi:N-acetylgalactosamine kinase